MVRAGCVFVAGIQPSRTWMSGSFESLRWNAGAHRQDQGLYSHPKELIGEMESEPMLTPREKSPLPEAQRRFQRATLHHAGQRAQHTTDWAIPDPVIAFSTACVMVAEASVSSLMEVTFEFRLQNTNVKKNNNFICIATEKLKYLDITNFLAPGFSYAKYLKAFAVKETIFFFFFFYVRICHLAWNALKQKPPPNSLFQQTEKNTQTTKPKYAYCQDIWGKNTPRSHSKIFSHFTTTETSPSLSLP